MVAVVVAVMRVAVVVVAAAVMTVVPDPKPSGSRVLPWLTLQASPRWRCGGARSPDRFASHQTFGQLPPSQYFPYAAASAGGGSQPHRAPRRICSHTPTSAIFSPMPGDSFMEGLACEGERRGWMVGMESRTRVRILVLVRDHETDLAIQDLQKPFALFDPSTGVGVLRNR